jgi:hypothetical protein
MIISELHWNYFHLFIDIGSQILYPLMQNEISSHMNDFNLSGSSGCMSINWYSLERSEIFISGLGAHASCSSRPHEKPKYRP